MMTRIQYLLSKLAEEAAEVAQIALKAQIFGLHERYLDDPTNIERVTLEINDMLAIIEMINEEAGNVISVNEDHVAEKIAKVEHYMEYSRQQGLLEADRNW